MLLNSENTKDFFMISLVSDFDTWIIDSFGTNSHYCFVVFFFEEKSNLYLKDLLLS